MLRTAPGISKKEARKGPGVKHRLPLGRRDRVSQFLHTGGQDLSNHFHIPQHSAVFVQSAARELLARGYGEGEVFSGTGFCPRLLTEEHPVADFADSVRFMEHAAELAGDDLFGFSCGKTQDARCAGIMYYAAQTAPTLLEAIRRGQRFGRLFNSTLDMNAENICSDGRLRWSYRISPGLPRRQYVEMAATVTFKGIGFFTQHQAMPKRIEFEHPRRRGIGELEKFYGCETVFGAPENVMVFDRADLELPLTTSDKQLSRVLHLFGEQALCQGRPETPALVLEVERAISARLADGQATLEAVAQGLGMSARTLSRKLSQDGTSFFRILEDLRKSQAMLYLRDSDLVLAEIAFLLGYSGLSSFNDAFKRWTGVSPGQFRTQESKTR